MMKFNDIWNANYIKLVSDDIEPEQRNSMGADFLEDMILKAKDAYYNEGNPILSDQDYDKAESYLRTLRPDSIVLEKVGS